MFNTKLHRPNFLRIMKTRKVRSLILIIVIFYVILTDEVTEKVQSNIVKCWLIIGKENILHH